MIVITCEDRQELTFSAIAPFASWAVGTGCACLAAEIVGTMSIVKFRAHAAVLRERKTESNSARKNNKKMPTSQLPVVLASLALFAQVFVQ